MIWNPRASRWNAPSDFIELEIEEQTKALQAMLGARREAEARLADLEQSLAQHAPQETGTALGCD